MVGRTARAVLRGRPVWMAVVGVTLICAVFVGLLASAWWDPPSRTHNVSVALVNEDAGFVVPAGPAAGQKRQIGAKVAKALTAVKVDSETLFDWHIVASRKAALQGMDDGDYVLTIVIPKDFSARLAALGSYAGGSSGGSATASSSPGTMEIIPDQANAAYEMSLITAMAQGLVQKVSANASAELVQQMAAAASGGGQTTAAGDQSAGAGQAATTADPRALAVSEPIQAVVTPINPVDRYGKSIGLVFFMLFMAIGGLALAVASHVVTKGQRRPRRFPVGLVLGRWLGLLLPAVVLAVLCTACIQLFGFAMESAATTYGIMMLGVVAFMSFNLMLGAVLGVVGLPIAVLLVPLQVAAGGAMMGPELTPGFYQAISTVIPYTYTLDGLRQGMFGGGGAGTAATALAVMIASCLALALVLCFVPGLSRGRRRLAAPTGPGDRSARTPQPVSLSVPATVPEPVITETSAGERAAE